jgi:hypothetical protein
MARLSKEQLKAKMQANSPAITRTVTAVPLTDLTGAKPNGANAKANLNVPKLKGRKDNVVRTERYSFEIYPELKKDLEQAIADYRKRTGKDISKSQVIRNALEKHLKGNKL